MSQASIGWRPMTAADLSTVSAIAAAVHQDYPEDDAVFAERLALFPDGCLMAAYGGALVGYAMFHPGVLGCPPKLNSLLGALPEGADCLYLHDVALLDSARGLNLGGMLLDIALSAARVGCFSFLALSSTPGAVAFWRKHGFDDASADGAARQILAGYGPGMLYLARRP